VSIIFGPINSRRFGKSLGVDLSPSFKQCNFDCLYCELKSSKVTNSYKDIVGVDEVIKEIKEALEKYKDIDFITITANGEPTLYPNLKELIKKINSFKGNIKSLILSNGSTIYKKEVQEALIEFDVVKLSLDCATKRCFKRVDRASKEIDLEDIKRGMLEFRKKFKNRFQIEILFVKGINDKKEEIEKLNQFLLELKPNIIDLNSIDRPPAYRVEGLSYNELFEISTLFSKELNINIANKKRIDAKFSYSKEEILETIKRRPLKREDIEALFDINSKKELEALLKTQKIELKNGFYQLKE